MTDLLKPIEELDDDEKETLVVELLESETAYTDIADRIGRGSGVRVLFEAGQLHEAAREPVALVLNAYEASRRLTHVMLAIAGQNLMKARDFMCSAACAFCDWKYRDESWDWPADRAVTDEDLQAVDARTKAEIRAHVMACPNHPMRELEGELAALHAHDTDFGR